MDAALLNVVRVTGTIEQPGRTTELLAACDALFHFLPQPQDIEHAVQLLVGAELIVVGHDSFGVTPAGRTIVARVRGGAEGRIAGILEQLKAASVTPKPWRLDPRLYEQACLDHQHQMWSEFRKDRTRNRYRL